MTEVAVSNTDPNIITCLGPKIIRCYKLQEGKLKLVHSQVNGTPKDITQVSAIQDVKELIKKIELYNSCMAK